MDRTLSGATITDERSGNNDGEGVLCIPQICSITGVLTLDLVSYPGRSFEESYPAAEMQSVNSTAPADWDWVKKYHYCFFPKAIN